MELTQLYTRVPCLNAQLRKKKSWRLIPKIIKRIIRCNASATQ